MKLYYLAATDQDGNNNDLMAYAENPSQAFDLWEGYYYPDAAEWRESGDEPHDYTGELLPPKHLTGPDDFYDVTVLRIYQVPHYDRAKALPWNDTEGMEMVAWKKEVI